MRVWLRSAIEVGELFDSSDVSANGWLCGKTILRREQRVNIRKTLGISWFEVQKAAGYNPVQDDSYNTYATIIVAVEQDQSWLADKRKRVYDALIEAISPAFNGQPDAAEWKDLASLVLHQKSEPLAKAEKIAGIIELWHNQEQK